MNCLRSLVAFASLAAVAAGVTAQSEPGDHRPGR